MRVIEKKVNARCEWCEADDCECSILLYGAQKAMLLCDRCLEKMRSFLVDIDVKEAEA